MRQIFKLLSLLLLLMIAQQGAVVHELTHLSGIGRGELQVQAGGIADTICAQCPAFAQVVTPAFSHAFHVPLLGRAAPELSSEPKFSPIDTAVPRPRSRGPPSSS